MTEPDGDVRHISDDPEDVFPNEITRVATSGQNNEYVHIGNSKLLRSDLEDAMGANLRPGLHPLPTRKFGNASALGLMASAMTWLLLCFTVVRVRHLTAPNIVIGMGWVYGGLTCIVVSMWEIAVENTFGAAAMSSTGGFFISYAVIYSPQFGIRSSYDDEMFADALGCYFMCFFILFALYTVCTIRSTVVLFTLFVTRSLTFLLLGAGLIARSVGTYKAGGWVGIVSAALSFYSAFAGFADKSNSHIQPLTIPMPGAQHVRSHKKNNKNAKKE